MTDTTPPFDPPHDHVDKTIYLLFLISVDTLNIQPVVRCRFDRMWLLDRVSVSPINFLNKPCHYLANLATMILESICYIGVLTICSD
jgi:hypothetical protein